MKQLGWTSIEQSKKLIEAGLNLNTADMFYLYDWNNHKHKNMPDTLIICNWEDPYNKSIPCWSLGALIELMPEKTLYMQMDNYWTVTFDRDEEHIDQFSDKTLIGALCEAIEWLVENNYIKKGN